ncbi:GtrA family protein [Saccharopolyspora sp. HNM0983]|uniref:GtrA family protein n=2 Tax=Saccharopolyspora montiporae TaxID=2781240 RepID=A0A929BEC5_9PSEU|nr:GtrA family protein [Saccharopolyspora sp. HNM0983]
MTRTFAVARALPAFLRFLVVGAASAGVYYLLYQGSRQLVPYLVAHALALSIAMVAAYLLNCRYTFRVRPSLRGMVLYPLSNLGGFAVSAPALYLLVDHLGLSQLIAPLLAQGIATPVTFLVARFVLLRSARHRDRSTG